MSTLTEIEQAAEQLPAAQKQELMLFLDTSVLLSACVSASGASREIFLRALRCQPLIQDFGLDCCSEQFPARDLESSLSSKSRADLAALESAKPFVV